MKTSYKWGARAATLALTVAGFGIVAAPAYAAGPVCRSISNGSLCLQTVINGFNIFYIKTGGATANNLNFRLTCTNGSWFGDNGAFSQSAGQTKSYTFAIGAGSRTCYGSLLQNNVTQVTTPYITG